MVNKVAAPLSSNIKPTPLPKNKTKIVATVGPSCDSYEKLLELAQLGVNVFRLNFSHGDHEGKLKVINHIRKIMEVTKINLAIMADLQGPKLRVGQIENNALVLKENDSFLFTNELCVGDKNKVYISYPNFSSDVQVGNVILIDDGKIECRVVDITANREVKVKVMVGGTLSSNKGVNLPDTKISLPALTEKDLKDLEFIITHQCDWIALSFVRSVKDIVILRSKLEEKKSKTKIIAKIEKPEALLSIRDIILESDAIMVARGDLGVELPLEKIPLIQKDLIRKCIHRAKPVIVATQMMESMISFVKPNRSEITDVANAVLEGADAVMLSAETASGNHPNLVVNTMRTIIEMVESTEYKYNREDDLTAQSHSPNLLSDAICYNACKIANEVNAKAIIGMTQSGYTGFTMSSYRPKASLFIFTKEKTLVSQLALSWGVSAYHYGNEESLDKIIEDQIEILKQKGLLSANDVVINTGSTPIALHLPTNIIKITRVT
ncbi:MAG: pyruvate kinase [Phycisphaerales bacterium]|nr:pyruvate kinase [Phycisphaerales bacterium]